MDEQLAIIAAPEQEQSQVPIIRLMQLPVIQERLREVKPFVEARVQAALAMPCTDDTLTEIKATRAELNALFAEAETQRKGVKQAIMEPYNNFEAVYKECISAPFSKADAELCSKVNAVENGMKQTCEDGLREHFAKLTTSHHLAWLKYEQAGIKISLTDAKAKTQPPKKHRDHLTQFVESVARDVDMILSLMDAAEIMEEYRRSLNATQAIQTVNLRHQRIREAQIEAERLAEQKKREQEAAARVAEAAQQFEAPKPVQFAPPVPVQEQPPEAPAVFTVKFAVSGTLEQLKYLKRFLEDNGYNYEDIQ